MRFTTLRLVTVFIALFAFSIVSYAQNRERFGISAKAGGVNAVAGQVMVKREGQAPQLLTSHDNLITGDVVRTGFGAEVEILLNPGSYLRLAENSEFTLVDSSLDTLLVKLNSGSAIIEATGPDSLSQYIPIMTAQQKFTILRAGIYRVNAKQGMTEIFVRKGRIILGDNAADIVKSGKKVTVNGNGPTAAKLTKADTDDFDDWSKERGKTLARANERLNARTLSGFLSSSAWSWPGATFGRLGLWTWSPFASCYTFLPFSYGWGSPYGGFYGMFAGFGGFSPNGSCCRTHVDNQPVIVSNPGYNNGSNGTTRGTTGSGNSGSYGVPSGGTNGVSMPAPSRGPDPRSSDSGAQWVNKVRDPIN